MAKTHKPPTPQPKKKQKKTFNSNINLVMGGSHLPMNSDEPLQVFYSPDFNVQNIHTELLGLPISTTRNSTNSLEYSSA